MTGALITARPLRELRTLYEAKPQIRDVIVEGRSDARFIKWYLSERQLFALAHAVDDRAEIPSSQVLSFDGEVGPRGRVIGVAHQVDEWKLAKTTVTCIIDSDRAALLEAPTAFPGCLLTTDFGSMEVYFLQTRPFSQFLRLVLGRDEDPDELIKKLIPALNEICVVRAVLHWSGLGIPLVRDFAACCEFTRDSIAVDTNKLLDRTLSGRDRDHRDNLLGQVQAVRTRVPKERRLAIRGHDIAPLLIRELGLRNVWATPEHFEAAWRGCVQASDLDEFPMFTQLRQRVG